MSSKRSVLAFLSLTLILTFGVATLAQDTTLTMLTHWGTEDQLAAQQAIIDAYMESNPDVSIELVTVDFGELRTKIITGRTAGISADVYHFYHLWLPDFVNSGVLDMPPEGALAFINDNVAQGTIDAVSTSDGQTWGYPTEVNPYLLVYNKRLLADRQKAVVAEVQRQVDALTLRAPFDGQVGQVQAVQSTNLAANAPVLGVVDLSKFEVEIKVPESFARDLAIDMPAQLTGGNGKPFPGEISAVSPEVVNGEVNARVRFASAQPEGLRQSQRMSVRVLLDTRKDVLKVERGPFVEQGNGVAYVMDGRTAVRRPVELGVSSLGEVEIKSGVQPGDRIVVSGSDLFKDAERVSVN